MQTPGSCNTGLLPGESRSGTPARLGAIGIGLRWRRLVFLTSERSGHHGTVEEGLGVRSVP